MYNQNMLNNPRNKRYVQEKQLQCARAQKTC